MGLVTITWHILEIYVIFSVRVACVITSEGSSEWEEYDVCDYFVMCNIRWLLSSPSLFVLSDERTSIATNHKDRCEPMCQRVPSTSENKKQKGTLVIRLLREKAIKNRPCL